MNMTLWLVLALFSKHFVVDFVLQHRYQYSNKGIYWHPGGLLHAGLHGAGTWICFAWWDPLAASLLALADAVIHYNIDWAKTILNARMGWGPTTHEQFWWLLGLDQFLHALTYIWLISLVT